MNKPLSPRDQHDLDQLREKIDAAAGHAAQDPSPETVNAATGLLYSALRALRRLGDSLKGGAV